MTKKNPSETVSFLISKAPSFMKYMLVVCMVFHTFHYPSALPRLLPVLP